MKQARAIAPCHVTGIFQIFDQSEDPLAVGSRGAGVSISQGVETTVRIEKSPSRFHQIRINGFVTDSAEVSKRLLDLFRSRFKETRNFIMVEHNVKVPIGVGLGTSGAAALSLALCLNEVFGVGLTKIEAAQLAHTAEVQCRTGLGTVVAETFGGVEIRTKPGAPGIGEIMTFSASQEDVVVFLALAPLSTKKLLMDRETCMRINEFGGILLDRLSEDPNARNLMLFSRQFAEHVGLINGRIRKVLDATDNAKVVFSMPMFGEAIFTLVKQDQLENILEVLYEHGADGKLIISNVDHDGARIIE